MRSLRGALVAAAAVATVGAHVPAHAGGLQLPTRGVRPTARGGAFVAGADDLGALWFNPAGLAALAGGEDRVELMVDVGYVDQSVDYTRIDSGMNEQEKVSSSAHGLPVPTLGAAFDIGDDLVIAGGLYAPYAGLGKYPEDGPQRYSVVDLSESLLLIMEVAVAYDINDRVRIGAGVQNMVFHLVSRVVFSGCPGQTICAPEDPEFDSLAQIEQTTYFSPSGVLGVQFDVAREVTIGASFQGPFNVSGTGHFDARLPSSGFFDGSEIVGDEVDVEFDLPAMLRFGVEVRPVPRLRAELATDIELWGRHDEFTIEPKGVRIEGAPGVGVYELGSLTIPREYGTSVAVQLGVEGQPAEGVPLTLLGGYAFETGAAPKEHLSVMTVDGTKHLIAGGVGYDGGSWALHGTFGYVVVGARTVDPDTGINPQLTPIRDDLEVYVNWGEYSSSWLIAGAGVTARF